MDKYNPYSLSLLDHIYDDVFHLRHKYSVRSFRHWFWMVVQYLIDNRLNCRKALKLALHIQSW